MFGSFLITLRETLEASLIVGIILAYLDRTNHKEYKKTVYYAVIFGIIMSIITAMLFNLIAGGLEGRSEEIFEGITMLIGAFLLTTMILWMMKQRHISKKIEMKVEGHLRKKRSGYSHLSIFLMVSVAILREGAETVIFLNTLNYSSGISLFGGLMGIIVAIVVSYIFFMSMRKIDLKRLFNISSMLLILFAAGLVAHGIHELEEANIISPMIEHVWNINPPLMEDGTFPWLHEKGAIGSFFVGLFGYNGDPSLVEVISYMAYLTGVFFFYQRIKGQKMGSERTKRNKAV